MPLSFDPFAIRPNHHEHSDSTSIIKLEESGRIFCPKCLDQETFENIDKVDDALFNQYVQSLFETLDQYGEFRQLRKIALTTLEIILKRRALEIKSDHEFHNMLRVINKIISNSEFEPNELPSAVWVISIITRSINIDPIPLLSITQALEKMLKYVKKYLYRYRIEVMTTTTHESTNFLRSASTIIKTYFNLIKRFSVDRTSDLMFPLHEKDSVILHQRKYRNDIQTTCLDFISNELIPNCWTWLSKISRNLEQHEQDMVGELFEAMGESFQAATRISYNSYMNLLIENDSILMAHTLIYNNHSIEFRGSIRKFLKNYVLYYIELNLGSDNFFKAFKKNEDIVETNHKNAILYSYSDDRKYGKTLFYLMINFLAHKFESRYYSPKRVEKVIKVLVPSSIHLNKSKVFLKVYTFLVASFKGTLRLSENVDRHFTQRLQTLLERRSYSEFDDEFCFDEKVFFWARKHKDFFGLVRVESIERLLHIGLKKDKTSEILETLLKNKHYKDFVARYFLESDSAAATAEAIIKFDTLGSKQANKTKSEIDVSLEIHNSVITQLSASLSASFHKLVLSAMNDYDKDVSKDKHRICELIRVIIIFLNRCTHFQFEIDEQFLKDMFGLMARLYESKNSEKYKEETIMITELVTQLMLSNSPYLMSILKHLNYFVLGIIYYKIANYECDDDVADSIARLIVTYDKIDYPLLHNVGANLYVMNTTFIKWMLSKSSHLHILSLTLFKRVLSNQSLPQIRASIATALILMIITNFEILHDQSSLEIFITLLEIDEVKYNPLLSRVPQFVPDFVREAVEKKLQIINDRPPTPTLSFCSSPSSEISHSGEGNTIFDILNQLNAEDNIERSNESQIPNSLFVTTTVEDQHCNSTDPRGWRRLANETTNIDD